ncbi:hypothetical protein [Kitasatospora sp. NPDC056181]|uniref:hypothetical protein n=1 Tax=Kitasatospora sp. NPDC056181 TaxID=3345737 RepID=UPI0035DD9EE4
MLATPRKTAAPTVTGRSYAARVASLTGGSGRLSSGAWVAEARGAERRRRAVVCRIARRTGTQAPQWNGEIGDENWQTVLAAGAEALLAAAQDGKPASAHLVATAREFAEEAAESVPGRVIDLTRDSQAEAAVDEMLADRLAAVLDAPFGSKARTPASDRKTAEQKAVERWSPFRAGPRHVVRCADGSRRYGDGSPAPTH